MDSVWRRRKAVAVAVALGARWCMQMPVSRLRSGVMTSLQLQQPWVPQLTAHSSQLTDPRTPPPQHHPPSCIPKHLRSSTDCM